VVDVCDHCRQRVRCAYSVTVPSDAAPPWTSTLAVCSPGCVLAALDDHSAIEGDLDAARDAALLRELAPGLEVTP
jgi:hypothetical protein